MSEVNLIKSMIKTKHSEPSKFEIIYTLSYKLCMHVEIVLR